jgi:hypothetical protein
MDEKHKLTMRMRKKSRRSAIASILYYSRNFRNGKVNKNEPVFRLPERISYRRGKRGEATRAPDAVKVAKTAPIPATKRPNVMNGPFKPSKRVDNQSGYTWTDIVSPATATSLGLGAYKVARYGYNVYDTYNKLLGKAPRLNTIDPWDIESQSHWDRINYHKSHVEL